MELPVQESAQLKFIYDKKYSDKEVINNTVEEDYFLMVKKGIDEIAIDNRFFKTVFDLIKFFKFPVLLTLKKPIERILSDPNLSVDYEKDLKKIAKIAKTIIGPSGNIYELQFLFKKGIDPQYYQGASIKISDQKKKFIDYIKKLSSEKKMLLEKLKQRSITEEDIMYFQSLSADKQLKFFERYFQNYIKSDIKQIELKYLDIQRQIKKSAKDAQKSKQEDLKQQTEGQSSELKQRQTYKQIKQEDLEEVLVCCRRFFYFHQIIYQPQSINVIYRNYKVPDDPSNNYEILKSVCGLLNASGGSLFIGIKEDKATCKKQVQGYTLIQKDKQEIRNNIQDLVDICVSPNISHDMLKILYVPIKSQQKKTYMSGKYLIKICVRFGERKQFYSFRQSKQSKKQYFAIRTDNDTKIMQDAQQILKIYKDRLLETPPQPQPVHSYPCPNPEVGRPLYEAESFGKRQ